MVIPDFQTVMLPILNYLAEGRERGIRDIIDHISNQFGLSEEEKKKLLPSGRDQIINNRVGWARTYMKKAGLLIYPKRGFVKITDRGLNILKENPNKINIKVLERFPEFIEFQTIKRETAKETFKTEEEIEGTPDELMEKGNNLMNSSLAQELLDNLRKADPYFFEKIVGRLLAAMGYGRFEGTPRSGDKGVDGIIHQDKLGLDRIFFQAKRYDERNTVNINDIRAFIGTLDFHGVTKGVFITTSRFPKDTEEIFKKSSKTIIPIDGPKLAKLMIEHEVGVSTEKTYKRKKIDSDFFIEE